MRGPEWHAVTCLAKGCLNFTQADNVTEMTPFSLPSQEEYSMSFIVIWLHYCLLLSSSITVFPICQIFLILPVSLHLAGSTNEMWKYPPPWLWETLKFQQHFLVISPSWAQALWWVNLSCYFPSEFANCLQSPISHHTTLCAQKYSKHFPVTYLTSFAQHCEVGREGFMVLLLKCRKPFHWIAMELMQKELGCQPRCEL